MIHHEAYFCNLLIWCHKYLLFIYIWSDLILWLRTNLKLYIFCDRGSNFSLRHSDLPFRVNWTLVIRTCIFNGRWQIDKPVLWACAEGHGQCGLKCRRTKVSWFTTSSQLEHHRHTRCALLSSYSLCPQLHISLAKPCFIERFYFGCFEFCLRLHTRTRIIFRHCLVLEMTFALFTTPCTGEKAWTPYAFCFSSRLLSVTTSKYLYGYRYFLPYSLSSLSE
jgi:hypothetical protein